MCVHICADTCVLFGLSERTGGAALMGDRLSLLQIWKWPETYAVRLIYCMAFTEMMKQSLALTIYRHTHPGTNITSLCACAHTPIRKHGKCILQDLSDVCI